MLLSYDFSYTYNEELENRTDVTTSASQTLLSSFSDHGQGDVTAVTLPRISTTAPPLAASVARTIACASAPALPATRNAVFAPAVRLIAVPSGAAKRFAVTSTQSEAESLPRTSIHGGSRTAGA